jgi:2-polyprenyl-6-methoxyphenol hydroxylase-like FAD-dependent oxidoreductase
MTGTTGATADHHVDVLVVGGGPAGMTAAGDLARCGRSVAVLERWPQINPSSRAFATMARTLEVLDSRDLADGLLSAGTPALGIGLFAGARLDLSHLRSRYPFVLVTPQTNVDQALGRYAVAQGADVHRGVEVTGLAQDATGVTVTARPKDDDDPSHQITWRASYVIGADGAHSTVRGLLGLDFPGRAVLSSVVLADVRLTAGPGGGLTLGGPRDLFGFLVPYGREDDGGAWYRSMTGPIRCRTPNRSVRTRSPTCSTGPLAATSASPRSAGGRASTARSGRPPATGMAGSSWPATPPTSIHRSAGRV